MEARDLFSIHRSSKRLNESLHKIFGKKINLEDFSLEQLEDARNKLRTQVSQVRSSGGFNETVENETFLQAKMMLDAIVAEITERDEQIIEADVEGKGGKALKKAEEYLAYMSDVFNDREEYDLANELHNLSFELEKVGIGGVMKELKQLTYWGDPLANGVYKEFSKKFGKFAEGFDADVEEGAMKDVDYDLRILADDGDEDQLIGALQGDLGQGVTDVLNDMMEELKDELAAKGMNDVMRDDDKMIEMLMDKLVDEYSADHWDDGGDMDSSDADADALKSAGFGSDEDYESIQYEDYEELDEISAELAIRARDKAKSSQLDNLMKAKSVLDKTKNIPIVSKIGRAMAQPNIDQAERRKRQANLADRKLGGMGQYRYDDKGEYGREGPSKVLATRKKESITPGEDMRKVTEGEVQQASAIVTAKTMVDRVGRWIEELSGMENETLLQLGDSIRDEMGQEQAKAFIESVAPAIQQALDNLKTTRDTLSTSVRSLASGEQPADMLGSEPAADGDIEEPAAEGDMEEPAAEGDMEEPAGDEFAAAEPAAGGAEASGREQRESVNYQNRLLKVLAG